MKNSNDLLSTDRWVLLDLSTAFDNVDLNASFKVLSWFILIIPLEQNILHNSMVLCAEEFQVKLCTTGHPLAFSALCWAYLTTVCVK